MTEEVTTEQTSPAHAEGKPEASQDIEKLQVNYENVKTALRVEREKRRQAEELLKKQTISEGSEDDSEDEEDNVKLRREINEVRQYGELIKLMNSDSFVKDNISDIQEIMENNKNLTALQASEFLKARALDAMYKGQTEQNQRPIDLSTKAQPLPTKDTGKDELMLNAIKSVL